MSRRPEQQRSCRHQRLFVNLIRRFLLWMRLQLSLLSLRVQMEMCRLLVPLLDGGWRETREDDAGGIFLLPPGLPAFASASFCFAPFAHSQTHIRAWRGGMERTTFGILAVNSGMVCAGRDLKAHLIQSPAVIRDIFN